MLHEVRKAATDLSATFRPDRVADDCGRFTSLCFRRTVSLCSVAAGLIALAGLLSYLPGLRLLGSSQADVVG